ncbi:hypothetical protein NB069_01705 [Leclercia adecarboxylata]|uniref:hypothetical protein n=1 Tax=Leclercia adecarboxylata TaxID=83655 RepID=UPI00202AA10C|nr:hypothetical protein [Leclercia adecarboxylata]URN99632.1 hypothetical protein NB069_01705 [Leclercia adecarboxylata]
MKELNTIEMQEIAAGAESLISRVAAAGLGAVTGAMWGTLIGGTQSGANGGLLGFGLFANVVGMFWGLAMGAVTGASGGFAIGWDAMMAINQKSMNNVADGQFVPWGH